MNVASGECLDVHHFAVLIGVGATTINAYAAEWTIAERMEKGLLEGLSLADAVANYRKAIEDGLLKIMSKMGISIIASYRGGYNFEALGLSRHWWLNFPAYVVTDFRPWPERDQSRLVALHKTAYLDNLSYLPVGGLFRYRKSGERHAFDGQIIHAMQHACDTGSYASWKKYVELVSRQGPVNLRDLLDFECKNPEWMWIRWKASPIFANGWSRLVSRLVRSAPKPMKPSLLR